MGKGKPRDKKAYVGTRLCETTTANLALAYFVFAFIVDKVEFFFASSTGDVGMLGDAGEHSIDRGSLHIQAAGALCALLCVLACGLPTLLRRLRARPILIIYLLYLSLSLLWTVNAGMTIRRLGGFLVVLLIGLALASEPGHRPSQALSTIYRFGILYFGIGLLALVRSLFIGIDFLVTPFAVFDAPHRDAEMLVTFLLFYWFYKKQAGHKHTALRFGVFAIVVIMLVLTLSRTSLIGFIACMIYVLLQGKENRVPRVIKVMGIITIMIAASMLTPSDIVERIVRPESSSTMTGRTIMWEVILSSQVSNPLVGVGFGAFWNPDRIYSLQNLFGWGITGAHNGFLDVYLNTGLVGLALLTVVIVTFWRATIRLDEHTKLLIRCMIIFILIQNLAQGSFQNHRNFLEVVFWILFCYTTVIRKRPSERG